MASCAAAWRRSLVRFCLLLAGKPHVNAQSSDSTASCPDSVAPDDKQPSDPGISIAEVTFSDSLQIPRSDQVQSADSIKRKTAGTRNFA